MTIQQIHKMLSGEEYNFLRTDSHLAGKIAFLVLGGSYAYGTNTETSDIDLRGCALNSPEDLLGLSKFEQFTHTVTDTTIYSFQKLIALLLNCNPNTIELLGCRPEHYLILSGIGKEIIQNQKLFLSKRAIYSFGGYANQQLRRLENALARDHLAQPQKEQHILHSIENAVESFKARYQLFQHGGVELYTAPSQREGLEQEIFADIHLQQYPVRDFNSMINSLANIVNNYEKLGHCNYKKDKAHMNKHAMHLVRLYLMCMDILEKEEVITYREKDHALLMGIRQGAYCREDGSYLPEFFELINNLEKRLAYAKKNTSLPEQPDIRLVEDFVISVNRRAL